MDFELLGRLGWREGLIAIIILLLVYIVFLVVRMRRLQHALPARMVPPVQAAVAAYQSIQEPAPPSPPVAATAPEEVPPVAAVAPARPEFAWNEPPAEIPGQAMIDALQREFYQLRCEVDELRAEVLAAREDFRRQSSQSAASTQTGSPLYNDAMQMAIQGHDATTIAHRCGIARAEADLVVSLARNRQEGF
ncbi:MAG: DUF2802 domain-containing protein [Candidatus Accumulibacter sp. UW26]|jgi:hypothetical protein